ELRAGGQRFKILLPPLARDIPSTMESNEPAAMILDALHLDFATSAGEELVTIALRGAGSSKVLGGRTSNYVLLLLARARCDEAARIGDGPETGWLYSDELAQMLAMSAEYLNVLVYRARTSFAAEGIVDASKIVERRPSTSQLRIGVSAERLHLP